MVGAGLQLPFPFACEAVLPVLGWFAPAFHLPQLDEPVGLGVHVQLSVRTQELWHLLACAPGLWFAAEETPVAAAAASHSAGWYHCHGLRATTHIPHTLESYGTESL